MLGGHTGFTLAVGHGAVSWDARAMDRGALAGSGILLHGLFGGPGHPVPLRCHGSCSTGGFLRWIRILRTRPAGQTGDPGASSGGTAPPGPGSAAPAARDSGRTSGKPPHYGEQREGGTCPGRVPHTGTPNCGLGAAAGNLWKAKEGQRFEVGVYLVPGRL